MPRLAYFFIWGINSSNCGRDSGTAQLPPDVWRRPSRIGPDRQSCEPLAASDHVPAPINSYVEPPSRVSARRSHPMRKVFEADWAESGNCRSRAPAVSLEPAPLAAGSRPKALHLFYSAVPCKEQPELRCAYRCGQAMDRSPSPDNAG